MVRGFVATELDSWGLIEEERALSQEERVATEVFVRKLCDLHQMEVSWRQETRALW